MNPDTKVTRAPQVPDTILATPPCEQLFQDALITTAFIIKMITTIN